MGSQPFPSSGDLPNSRTKTRSPHCRQILYQLSHKKSQRTLEWVAYPFSSGSSQPRDQTVVSCIACESFTSWPIREANNIHRVDQIRNLTDLESSAIPEQQILTNFPPTLSRIHPFLFALPLPKHSPPLPWLVGPTLPTGFPLSSLDSQASILHVTIRIIFLKGKDLHLNVSVTILLFRKNPNSFTWLKGPVYSGSSPLSQIYFEHSPTSSHLILCPACSRHSELFLVPLGSLFYRFSVALNLVGSSLPRNRWNSA